MATVFTEDFESGSNGAAITTLNTGYTQVNGTTQFQFDSSTAETGALSAHIVSGATAAGGTLDQTFSPVVSTKRVMRRYFRLAQLPPSATSCTIMRVRDGSGNTLAQLVLNPNGTLQMRNQGGVNVGGVSTFVMTTNEWFRVVWTIDVTNSTQNLDIFYDANLEGSTANETHSGAYTGGSITKLQEGIGTPISSFSLWLDAAKDDDTTDPGPAGTPPSGGGTFTETFDSGTDGAAITTSNTAYDAVSGGIPTFDATTVFSGLSAKFSTSGTATGFTLNQNLSPAIASRYFRRYFLLMNLPASTTIVALMRLRLNGATTAQVVVDDAGKVSIRNGGATTVASSIFAVPLGSWFRISWRVDNGAGTQTLKIYSGTRLQSAAPTETLNGAYTSGTFNTTNEGLGTPQSNFTMWMDSAADDTGAEPGALGGSLSLRAKVRQPDTSWKPGVTKIRQPNGTWKIGAPKAHDGSTWV